MKTESHASSAPAITSAITASSAARTTAVPVPATPLPTASDATPTVQLHARGAGPRTPLRYKFLPGQIERVKLVQGGTVVVESAGKKTAVPNVPDIEVAIVLKVLAIDPEGGAKRELSLERIGLAGAQGLDDKIRHLLGPGFDALKNLSGHDAIDAAGRLRSLKIDVGPIVGPEGRLLDKIRQSFAQMAVPFPDEPIGLGARWTVRSGFDLQDMKVQQAATYELIELKGNTGRAKVRLTQHAGRGALTARRMPAGMQSAELLGMRGRGEGDVSFDLTRSVPEGEIKTQIGLEMRTVTNGKQQDTKVEVEMRNRFTRE